MGVTRIPADAAGLSRCRFAPSPIWETVIATRAFVDAASP
jgi:hypothetical protein